MIALITGCSSGIGKELCKKLKANGDIVIATARNLASITQLDARYELAPYQVQVTALEPGPMETEFFHTVAKNSDSVMGNAASPYHFLYAANRKTRDTQKKVSADDAAMEICQLLRKKKLSTRYFIALPHLYRIGIWLHLTCLFSLVHTQK